MKSKKSLPDFIVIGAAKSGTSWLYKVLGTHPEIYLPSMELSVGEIEEDLII